MTPRALVDIVMLLLATVLMAAMAAMAPAVQAQTQTQTQPAPIRIGFVCPFTGGSQDFGNSARLGAELAVKEINEVGGYLGRRIELIERDDQANPDEGRRIAEEFVLKQKVAFTVGYCNTGVTLKSIDVFQANRALLVVTQSTGSAVTAAYAPKDSYIFRMAVRDVDQAAFLVDEAVGRAGFTKLAILADNSGYGAGGLKDLTQFLAAKGLQPVYVGRFDVGAGAMNEQMAAAKAAGAQAILGYTLGPEYVAMLKSRADAQFAGPLFASQPASFNSVQKGAGKAAEGARVAVTLIHDLSNERRSSFIARLGRHAGVQPVHSLIAAAQAYDSVQLMMRVIFQTNGKLEPAVLKAALEDLQSPYRGVVTNHVKPFSPTDHDAFTRNMMWLGQWRGSEIVFAHAEDAKRSSVLRTKSDR